MPSGSRTPGAAQLEITLRIALGLNPTADGRERSGRHGFLYLSVVRRPTGNHGLEQMVQIRHCLGGGPQVPSKYPPLPLKVPLIFGPGSAQCSCRAWHQELEGAGLAPVGQHRIQAGVSGVVRRDPLSRPGFLRRHWLQGKVSGVGHLSKAAAMSSFQDFHEMRGVGCEIDPPFLFISFIICCHRLVSAM